MLEIRAGDGLEHAIFLCNLIKGLFKNSIKNDPINETLANKNIYIILGRGIPEG